MLASAVLLLLGACRAEPKIELDLRQLDTVPVVPLVMKQGASSALIRPDGRLLTCSHAIGRGEAAGETMVAGIAMNYAVLASGDGLAVQWRTWNRNEPQRHDLDWALLSVDQPVSMAGFVAPGEVALSVKRPEVGETLYLVGYTVEGTQLVRYWAVFVVVPKPSGDFTAEESLVWIRAGSGASEAERQAAVVPAWPGAGRLTRGLMKGLSGSPILRHTKVGGVDRLEACGIFVGAGTMENGKASDYGVAIPLPELLVKDGG